MNDGRTGGYILDRGLNVRLIDGGGGICGDIQRIGDKNQRIREIWRKAHSHQRDLGGWRV